MIARLMHKICPHKNKYNSEPLPVRCEALAKDKVCSQCCEYCDCKLPEYTYVQKVVRLETIDE